MTKTLNIVGCGKVGQTLGRLWASGQVFLVQDVLNRTIASSTGAVAFIGAGRPVSDYREMRLADVYMLSVPDDHILGCCEELERHGHLRAGSVVFQCSGARPSGEMLPALRRGASVASVHPIRSFADPGQTVRSFAGTFCGAEGDAHALGVLEPAFSGIGAQLVRINADAKVLYHAAAVFACNYVVTLIDIAQQAFLAAGIPRHMASLLLEPLVKETIGTVFKVGPETALTGPIARGDMETVARQLGAVESWHPQYGRVYRELAEATKDLARRGAIGAP